MKVVKAKEMASIEKKAFEAGASAQDFMETAGLKVAKEADLYCKTNLQAPSITLVCGKGNNGGDAYVAGCHLLQMGYKVQAFQLFPSEQCSPLSKLQSLKFASSGGQICFVQSPSEIELPISTLILDGILGTGFSGGVEGLLAQVIDYLNQSKQSILAVDIPSGLNGNTGEITSTAIQATFTVCLGLPKTGFFLRKGWQAVGKLVTVDFGLADTFLNEAEADFELIDINSMANSLPAILRTRHKYERGYVVGLTGSLGMAGAAILSGSAALRGGAGIVRLWHPEEMQNSLGLTPPELIHEYYKAGDAEKIIASFSKASALYFGPGIGRSTKTFDLLYSLIAKIDKPSVFDADALSLIAEKDNLVLPSQTILTPHTGEMAYLLHEPPSSTINEEYIRTCQNYAEKKKITLIHKGAPTFIFHPNTLPKVCLRGDPGMATAGSGDVLTGLLAALLAQKLSPLKAAQLGVFLHGMAGELAASINTSYSVIASDIIDAIPAVYKQLLILNLRSSNNSLSLSQ